MVCNTKNRWYKLRKILVLLLLPVLCCLWTGFDPYIPNLESPSRELIDAIIIGDQEAAWALRSDKCNEEDYNRMYDEARESLAGLSEYRIHYIDFRDESLGLSLKFEVLTPEQSWIVEVTGNEDVQKIHAFIVTDNGIPKEQVVVTGSLSTLGKASFVQQLLIFLAVLEYVFMLLTVLHCAFKNIRKQGLWILLIFFGVVSVGAHFIGGFPEINFNVLAHFRYTALFGYWNDTFELRLMIPVGAILYWIFRKKITIKAQPYRQNDE